MNRSAAAIVIVGIVVLVVANLLQIRQADRMFAHFDQQNQRMQETLDEFAARLGGTVPAAARVADEQPTQGGEYVVRLSADIPNLCSWLDTRTGHTKEMNYWFTDRLAERDFADPQNYLPLLATRWEIDGENNTYTFHLREGVRWHDGTPFTAQDVRFAFETIMNEKIQAVGMRSYLEDMDGLPEIVGRNAIRFKWKVPYFKAFDAICEVDIYPRHLLEFAPDEEKSFAENPFHRHPIGTGPFKFKDWQPDVRIVFERNDDYWGTPPYVDEIEYRIIPDWQTQFQEFLKGNLTACQLQPQQWITVADSPDFAAKFNKTAIPRFAYFFLGWNSQRPPFDDPLVRRAMTHVAPRTRYIDKIVHGLGQVLTGPFYPGEPSYDRTIEPYAFNPAKAKELLAQAGWQDSDGDGFLDRDGEKFEFTFLVPSNQGDWQKLAVMLKEEVTRIGVAMHINNVEWAVFIKRIREHQFEAMMCGFGLDWDSDPYQVWHSSQAEGGNNFVGFGTEQTDRLIEQARRTLDPQKRHALYQQLHRIIHEEQPFTFLYVPKDPFCWDKHYHIDFYSFRPNRDARRVFRLNQ